MWNPQSRQNINHHRGTRHISYWALHSHESLGPCWENQWSKNVTTCICWCAFWLHPQSLSVASSTQSFASRLHDTHAQKILYSTQSLISDGWPRKKGILHDVRNNDIKIHENYNMKMSDGCAAVCYKCRRKRAYCFSPVCVYLNLDMLYR